MDKITVLKYAYNMALIEFDKAYERAKKNPSAVHDAMVNEAKDALNEIRDLLYKEEATR